MANAQIDFHAFHRDELPARLQAGNGALAAADAHRLRSIAFRLQDGAAYTYVPRGDGIEVHAGDGDADTVMELSREDWQGVVEDLESAPGLLYAGRARCLRGKALRFVRWEPALRAMFHGLPVFDPARVDLRDRGGAPLDPACAFTPADDVEEMAHFLRTTGYILVRGIFDEGEVEGFRAAAERLRAAARKGDKRSWWAKDGDGNEVLCRVLQAAREPALRTINGDPRLARIAALSDTPLIARPGGEENGVAVLWKHVEMKEGLSDLPFHRDCGMGGHASMCPVMVCTVSLSEAHPNNGGLRMLPGSHRGTYPFIEAQAKGAPQGVALHTQPGDVSFHVSDVMHASPPPTEGPLRIAALVAFVPKTAHHHRGGGSYNDVLLSRDDGQVEHLRDVAERDIDPDR